ncbi:hypothetical protein [Brevibacillus laterosporus]|uniref:hypothetical protein n=1 Tax=Brevibacillus laterosporus TaxID=1465 RepID=UPI001443AF97|nr:hypothetical protein [Brevibacillus laterosporus]NKQ20962.1 hypothetical protein [Brevibacillus laterosporus]WNX30678.1 hypothetical protein RWW94_21190 [Brevibacillus laterosporus]
MEEKLIKSAKYGFLVGLAIMILIVPEEREIHLYSGGMTTQELTWMEYILRVVRYTIIFTSAVVLMTFFQEKRGLQNSGLPWVVEKILYIVLGFLVVTAIGILLSFLAPLLHRLFT